jgi:hypothetical protein
MKKHNLLMLVLLIMGLFVMQSCLKDKNLFKDEIRIDIEPSYGVPLANLNVYGEDIAGVINQKATTFRVEFDPSQEELAIVVWDKEDPIPSIALSAGTTGSLPLNGSYPLNFLTDFRKIPGLIPHQAYLDFYVDNNLNEDVKLIINALSFTESGGGTYSIKSSSSVPDTITITAHTMYKYCYRILIDVANIPNLLIMKGLSISYDIEVGVVGTVSASENVHVYPVLRMPAWLELHNWHRTDTVDFDMSSMDQYFNDSNFVSVKDAELYVYGINAIPTNETVQLYFTDENYVILDSLRTNELIQIESAVPEADYHVRDNTKKYSSTVVLTNDRFKKLENAKHLIIDQLYSSYQNRDVKLFRDNYLGIKVAIKVNTKVSGKINDADAIASEL